MLSVRKKPQSLIKENVQADIKISTALVALNREVVQGIVALALRSRIEKIIHRKARAVNRQTQARQILGLNGKSNTSLI